MRTYPNITNMPNIPCSGTYVHEHCQRCVSSMTCHEEPRMHFCGLHCIKFTVISKFQVEGLRARDFFQDGIFKKNFSFRMDFFDYFFRLSIFWGCSFDVKIGLLSIYEVFRAIPALLHPVWSQLRISCFMNSIFFFEVEIFSEMPFFIFFFRMDFFDYFFFAPNFFGV